VINKEIDKLLKEGAIEPSVSAWSSPIVMVIKPNGEYRMCLDLRKVNASQRRILIPYCISKTPYVSCGPPNLLVPFTLKMVFGRSHLNLPVGEKTAFTVPGRGLFQFVVMLFGLCNAPAIFQRLLNTVLKEEMGIDASVIWMIL
jgi:hypothetical protein